VRRCHTPSIGANPRAPADGAEDAEPVKGPRHTVCLVGGPDVDARQELMRRLAKGFDVCAVGTDPALAASFAASEMRYRTYEMSRGTNPLRDIYSLWQLIRIFRSERPTIVHTFDSKPAVWGRLAARLARVPVVIGTLPGLGSLYSTPGRKGRLVRIVYQPLQTLACRLSNLTVFQNEDDAREFQRRHVVTSRRSTVIPGSGVRTDLFAPGHANAKPLERNELELPEGGLVVVMISRVLRSKGVLDFAAAARETRRKDPTINFLLVGPADVESLDALTASEIERLRDAVTWIGPRTDVKNVLAASDIFVFPSFYREGIPRVLLEAASMGLPLVAADVPGSREAVEDGVNGMLTPPRDSHAISEAVLHLAEAPELRQRLGESSRARAIERFDSSIIAERTETMYRTLLAAQ
jgi:glycosyltransferase involved in cell wall biosynthesis